MLRVSMLGRVHSGQHASTSAPCRPAALPLRLPSRPARCYKDSRLPKATSEREGPLAGDENGMLDDACHLAKLNTRVFHVFSRLHTTNHRYTHADFEPELPSQIDLPEGWEKPSEEKTAVQKFLYPDEDELTSDFAVSPPLVVGADDVDELLSPHRQVY